MISTPPATPVFSEAGYVVAWPRRGGDEPDVMCGGGFETIVCRRTRGDCIGEGPGAVAMADQQSRCLSGLVRPATTSV